MWRPKSPGIENSDLLEVAIVLCEVESIADNEHVGDSKPYVVQRDRVTAARFPSQSKRQCAGTAGSSKSERSFTALSVESRIDNVLHEKDILTLQAALDILLDAEFTGGDGFRCRSWKRS